MQLANRPLMGTSVHERDIDLILLQLIETVPSFRAWLCSQFDPEVDCGSLLSVCRSVRTTNGESDIEIAMETDVGDRQLFLLENKIDAELQEAQAERYDKRGQSYVKRGMCDRYAVGLVAPEAYITDSDEAAFGTVISYESIREVVDNASYDARPFVIQLLDQAIEKQALGHNSFPGVTSAIRTRFEERRSAFPPITVYEQSKNLLRFQSTAPDHPAAVRYSIWVVGNSEGREAMVRLSLDSTANEDTIGQLQQRVADHFDQLDNFELRADSTMWTVRTTVMAEQHERPTNEEYIDEIVRTLHSLVNYYHPILRDCHG